MDDNFLQSLLKSQLFDIGDSDDRLKWLQQSIEDLSKKLKGDYSLLPKYSLVALDPNISDNEQVLADTEQIVTTYWKALRGKYPEMPRNILRGVILNAIYNVGIESPLAARIIYLTALNFYPYAKLNNERDLANTMLTELGDMAEKNAIEEWSLIDEEPVLKLGTLKVGALKFEPVKIDDEKLREKWREALENDPSGHGPQHGLNNAQYKAHFLSKTTEGISISVNSAFENLSKTASSVEIDGPINKFFTEFKKNLDSSLKTSFLSLTAVERRSKLLWWKETLYSPTQRRSYREFDKHLLPIMMSADLNNQVPLITPVSVDYLLRDTLFLLNNKQDISISFTKYLTEISKVRNKPVLKTYFNNNIEKEGRISITDFISLLVNDRININNFKERTGIDDKEEITFGDLSVVVLHDFLTQRLITE